MNDGDMTKSVIVCIFERMLESNEICIQRVDAAKGLGFSVQSTWKPYPQLYNQQHKQKDPLP